MSKLFAQMDSFAAVHHKNIIVCLLLKNFSFLFKKMLNIIIKVKDIDT